jgi:uncharacterized protein
VIKINTFHIGDLPLPVNGTEDAAVLELQPESGLAADGEIQYQLYATMTGMDLLVTGSAKLSVTAECGCCLEPFPMELSVKDVCHLYPNAEGQEIDITEDIREDLLLALPIVFKCSEKCKGICAGCGANLNTEKCSCKKTKAKKEKPAATDEPSPWDALSGLKF